MGLAALLNHFSELGPVGDAAALGLVHVLLYYGVAVGIGIVFERPQLGRHGQVDVPACHWQHGRTELQKLRSRG